MLAVAAAAVRHLSGRRCRGDLWCNSRQSEQVAKQVASAQTRRERSKRRRVRTAFFSERDVDVVVEIVLTNAYASLSNQLKECEE